MRLVDARDQDGNVVEVWVKKLPKIGGRFRVDGKRYTRVPNGAPMSFGSDLDFKSPVVMWSEPLAGRGPVRAEHYDKDGFVVMTTNRERREYAARSQDTCRPVYWAK